MDILGYVDPNATVAIIRNGELVEKKTIELPLELRNELVCKNPRCITSTEQELPQVFLLRDREKRVYRCMYCEAKSK
jgi:aspartate carbamoyltransferase regulatory subunit